MQLEPPRRVPALRARLGAAACLLVAAGARTAAAQTAPPDASPRWQFDGATLLYGEKGRAKVIEPQARITRLFADGQTLSATLGLDVITGASPTGAVPSGEIQTTTTASGNVTTQVAGALPTHPFNDFRTGLDLEWTKPFGGRLTTSVGSHASIEKDYRSFGGTAKVSLAMMQRLTTLTVGGGYNEDRVAPTGGTRAPLTDGSVMLGSRSNPKRVRSATIGLSRILTRRWLLGVNATRSIERGYLTDPYKVISILDVNDRPVGQLTESRPPSRTRDDVLASSVYHLGRDIVYASYRYYWDDWGVTSHTADARYRLALNERTYLQPHVRWYFQSRANFFQFGLPEGAPLPAYASNDGRLGDLRTLTAGLTLGLPWRSGPGELSLRGEYMRQWGGSWGGSGGEEEFEEDDGGGSAPRIDFDPPVGIASVMIGYSIPF